MDPNAPNEDTEGLDEAIGTTDDTPAPEETLDEALADSLDRAIAEDDPGPEAPPADEPKPDDKPAEGDEQGAKPEGEKQPDPGKAPEAAEKPDAGKDEATEAEIASLGLKEKSAARFREMAAEIKELAPLREQLKAAGVESVDDLPKLMERSQRADDMIQMVMDTGATADQYGMTLDYLKMVNAARNGDPKAAEQAFAMVQEELATLARALGREVPGLHDPLAQHQDLAAGVENGDITREHAVELAAARDRTQSLQQHQQQTSQQQQDQAAQQQAREQLVQWDQQMQQDPAYATKRPMLDAMVRNIREMLPPSQWLQATQQAYAVIPDVPAPAPAPAPAPQPAPSPVRPGGPRGSLSPKSFDSVEDALDFALDGPASR